MQGPRRAGHGAGMRWHATRVFDVYLEWDHTSVAGGAAGGDRPDEDVLLGRVQAVF